MLAAGSSHGLWAVLQLRLQYLDDWSNAHEALSGKLDDQLIVFTTAFIRERYGIDAPIRPRTWETSLGPGADSARAPPPGAVHLGPHGLDATATPSASPRAPRASPLQALRREAQASLLFQSGRHSCRGGAAGRDGRVPVRPKPHPA